PGLRRDEVRGVQDAADARQGRRLQPLTLKVPGDRGRPVVEAVSLQLTAQLPDALANTLLDGPSVTPGLPGARLDRLDATLAITREEHVHPLPGDAVTTSRLAWSQRTVDDRKDDDPRLGHATASTMSRLIGQEPSVADVSTHASTMSWNQTLPGAPCDLSGDRRTTEPILVRSFSFSWV